MTIVKVVPSKNMYVYIYTIWRKCYQVGFCNWKRVSKRDVILINVQPLKVDLMYYLNDIEFTFD